MFDEVINQLTGLRNRFVEGGDWRSGEDDFGNAFDVLAGIVAELGDLVGIVNFL